jgi:hypothetical protein
LTNEKLGIVWYFLINCTVESTSSVLTMLGWYIGSITLGFKAL